MTQIEITIKNDNLKIEKEVFVMLIEGSSVSETREYESILDTKKVSLLNLKRIARKANVPYPLFFAPLDVVLAQLKYVDDQILAKLPSKKEVALSSRGHLVDNDLKLILRDLSRKQEFLKTRIHSNNRKDNPFVGLLTNSKVDMQSQAKIILDSFDIQRNSIQRRNKTETIKYIVKKVEAKGIYISFSSYNYMPKNIPTKAGFSGFCLKDKRYPFIFINRRDRDEKPLKWETEGRQILTLILMLICISKNRYVISADSPKNADKRYLEIYALAEELLMPKAECEKIKISTLSEAKDFAIICSVTPSAVIMRFKKLGLITTNLEKNLWKQLKEERKKIKKQKGRGPGTVKGLSKYNGDRFSIEILTSYTNRIISFNDAKNALFTNRKFPANTFNNYAGYYGF